MMNGTLSGLTSLAFTYTALADFPLATILLSTTAIHSSTYSPSWSPIDSMYSKELLLWAGIALLRTRSRMLYNNCSASLLRSAEVKSRCWLGERLVSLGGPQNECC